MDALTPQVRHPGAHAQSASPNPAAQLGNAGAQQLTGARHRALNAQMSSLFNVPLHDVVLRTDETAAARARGAGAAAYNDGREIGFAAGAFAPSTVEGRHRLVHEYAHVVQRRGGNQSGPALEDHASAELQARQAADRDLAGARPAATALANAATLYDRPGGSKRSRIHKVSVAQIERWLAAKQDVGFQVFRLHVQRLYPAATEQDIQDAAGRVKDLGLTEDVRPGVAKAKERHLTTINITVLPKVDALVSEWLTDVKKVKVAGARDEASGGGGKDKGSGSGKSEGKGTGRGQDGGAGTGADAGKTSGDAGTGATESPLGISSEPGTKIKAPNAAAAVEQLQAELDKETAARTGVEAKDDDGHRRTWPQDYADPEHRKLILGVMKEIVGEAPKLPENEDSKVPVSISSAEAMYLLKIATLDKDTRAAVIARLKGGDGLKGSSGQTLAQSLETAIENVEIEQHAKELGVKIEPGSSTKDPSRTPIENRPVRGRLINESGSALTVGERSIWKLEVLDDRDAFRVPHVYIAWAAMRIDKETKAVLETVSTENTHHIPVRDQGILNDSEFDFKVRKPGAHIVKAIVHHNFFRPAYMEELFDVEEEFPQSDRKFEEEHKAVVAKAGEWTEQFYDHGGGYDYRLGRKRTGKLDPKAHATTDLELISNLEALQKATTDNVELLAKQDESRRKDLETARDERNAELQKQIDAIKAAQVTGSKTLVVRGVFTSRVRGIKDEDLKLSCSVQEEKSKEGKTEYVLTMHDGTPRASRQVYHWTERKASVPAAQQALFLDIAEAYPFGTVSVLFQGYNHGSHQPTQDFIQFQKRTDTVAKDIKSVVFDERVDFAVNVIGFILSIIPVTAPIGIAITVIYNSAKGLSDNIDDAETGNFEKKKGAIALGDLVLNLLPLAPKIVKVGKATYWVIKAGSIAGGVVLMTAVGLEQARELRTGYVDVLVQKKQRLEELKRTNPAHPDIVRGTLQREIDELTKETSTATQRVFTQMAAQAAFMHVMSSAADAGFRGAKPGPLETRLLPEQQKRGQAIGALKEQGGFVHQDGAKPRYDHASQKIVADENTIKPKELDRLSREAFVDRELAQAGVPPKERAAVTKELSGLDADFVAGPKTEVVKGPGRSTVRVKKGATADDIRSALKSASRELKPDRRTDVRTFEVPQKPLPNSPQASVADRVNSRLSARAKAQHGEVRVEIVPEGEFGPSKTRADLRFENGKPVLRFEGEPRPGVLAEEIAHLEQLADPQFAQQRARLEAAAKKPWHEQSPQERLDAHRSKLELEADAQKRVIADLERQLEGQKVPPNDPRAVDIDNAFQNLEQIRSKLEETHKLSGELETHGGFVETPELLDTRPDLTNKKTTNKFPMVGNWKKRKQKEFIADYQDAYPDSKLTKEELKQRHRNGQRLNPESGRLKDPTLVDNPTPDVAAKVTSTQTIDVDAMNIPKASKKRIKGFLAERDEALAARDKARDAGQEAKAAKHGAEVNEASRKLGEAHAEAYMRENYPDFERFYPRDPDKPSRSGDFDQVWVKYGKPKGGGKPVVVEVIVIEAKGGSGSLSTRKVDGKIVQQGTGAYLDAIVAEMAKGTPEMQKVAQILSTLKPDQISYKVVRAPIDMTPGAKPQSIVVKIEVGEFDLKSTGKK